MSLTANFAGVADWHPRRRTVRPDDTSLSYGGRTMIGLVRDLGGVLGLGALALLWMAGTAPVLAIPIEIFGISPMAVTARWAVLPLAVAATLFMIRRTSHGMLAWRGFVAGLIAGGRLRLGTTVAGGSRVVGRLHPTLGPMGTRH